MPVTIPRNVEMERRARELYVPRKFGYKRVASELGIATTSVRRYVNPSFDERSRKDSRAAKQRRTGVCARCGGETRYNGRTTNGASSLCKTCNDFHIQTHCKNGHPLIPENRVRIGAGGEMCRLCRNARARERSARKRREAGIPERNPYRRPKEEALLATLEAFAANTGGMTGPEGPER